MKAISLWQPWATLMITGIKPIENRKWSTSYRGQLLIHASKTWDKEGAQWICDNFPSLRSFIFLGKHLLKGYLLGSVEMTDCVKYYDSKWFFGPYGFVFEDPVIFDNPIPYKGQLGIFEVPDSVIPLENPSETHNQST